MYICPRLKSKIKKNPLLHSFTKTFRFFFLYNIFTIQIYFSFNINTYIHTHKKWCYISLLYMYIYIILMMMMTTTTTNDDSSSYWKMKKKSSKKGCLHMSEFNCIHIYTHIVWYNMVWGVFWTLYYNKNEENWMCNNKKIICVENFLCLMRL